MDLGGALGPSHRIPLDPLGGPWTLGPMDPAPDQKYKPNPKGDGKLAKKQLKERLGRSRALARIFIAFLPPWVTQGSHRAEGSHGAPGNV